MMSSSTSRRVGKVKSVQTKFTWCIENIKEHCKSSDILSPKFTTRIDNIETRWQLYLSTEKKTNKDSENDEEYLGIYLKSLNSDIVRASVDFCRLSVYNKEVNRETLNDKEFEPNECWGFPNFVKRDFLINSTEVFELKHCTIICKITTKEYIKVENQKRQKYMKESLQLVELKNLSNLFDEKQFSDVVFAVDGKEIYAHKNLLANRSSVFRAMFTHDMSELKNNRVEVTDITYQTMHDMLNYIYTGIVPGYLIEKTRFNNFHGELLIAAEKYCIDNLKCACEKILSEHLSIDIIFEYLNFSDKHNASYLKDQVIQFIVDNGEDIAALPSFNKHCSELHADLVSEVFRALVTKRRKIE